MASRRSCWAIPSSASAPWFRAAIERFAALAGSDAFGPHMTLVGEVGDGWSSADVAGVLAGHGPFEVGFVAVDHEDDRYRCITLRADPAPLASLRARLLTVMPTGTTAPYRPHLSLLYGDRTPDARRALIDAADLPVTLPPITIDAVAVWDTTADAWSEWQQVCRWEL